MSKVSDFEVLKIMAERNKDIGIHLDTLNFQRDKRGGKVTVGVANPHFDHLINQAASGKQTHYAALYVINIDQFNEIKSELQKNDNSEVKS